ncbi:MAG: low molecular weight phosphotyrosine protein phosphatase [Verrucomicrobiae bacterium]|nr:low molecular weight phosphotyrosine protein phosphatase [Verrucomicrobiae bacterium]
MSENETEPDSSRPLRLLFVCMGNICRSPAAENVMRHLLEQQGLSHAFELDSAGTIRYHAGNPPDARMTEAARARGIAMTGRARQVKGSDLEKFDWVLVMDRDNLSDVQIMASHHGTGDAKVAMFCDFCDENDEDEVPDPYYGGPEGFEKVLDLLEDGCSGIIRRYEEGALG